MAIPNLFLIGSMRSGTTYLSELLGAHPAVFMSSPKELCHFVDGKALRRAWPHMWLQGYWRDADKYLAVFANAGDATVVGEASIAYSQAPMLAGVPARILAFNPRARFIYIMRDPIERTISHYWHQVRWASERRPMLEAIRSDPQYKDVSHYARQLKEYLGHVGLERIYVLTCEALLANTSGELRRLYAWLGVDPEFEPRRSGIPANERPEVIHQTRSFGVLDRLGLIDRLRRTSMYIRISPRIPNAVRRLIARFTAEPVRPDDLPVADVRAFLRPRQHRETEELSALLGRSFPEWLTLHAGPVCRCTPVAQRAASFRSAAAAFARSQRPPPVGAS